MKLSKATVGETYSIASITNDFDTKRRLEALGLTNHTQIKIINRNRTNSIILIVRGTRLAIGKKIADKIEV